MDYNFNFKWRCVIKQLRLTALGISLGVAILFGACATDEPSATSVSSTIAQSTTKLLALSNESPHVTVIDADTNLILKTTDIPELTKWTWNDDNNYFDGSNVWLGLKYPEADDAVVIALDIETLEVKVRLSVGKESKNIYIGKVAKNGVLHVGKQGAREIVTIDTKNHVVLDTWENMPAGTGEKGVVCDADIATGSDGIERYFYPTLDGNSVVSVNAATGEVLKETHTPEGSRPVMHTNDAQGRMWVQEIGSHTNAVFDPVTLDLIKRFPAAKKPVVGTFSPDGKYAYIGHAGDPIVQVIDTETLTEVAQVQTGNTPTKVAVHPNGKYIYAIASKEASVVVIETDSWKVTGRISLGVNPNGMFLWAN